MDIWKVGTLNQLFIGVFIFKLNFQKTNVVGAITQLSVVGPFVLPILFVLAMAFDRTVLYGNVAFSIVILSTKKPYSSFF